LNRLRSRFDHWWAHRTIRFRLALWYGGGGTLLLALFTVTLYSYVAVRLARPLDHQLRGDLERVGSSLRVRDDRTLQWNGGEIPEPAPWMSDHPWFELWDEQGVLVRRIWPFTENRATQLPGPPSRTVGAGAISVFYVAPDLRLRALTMPFPVPGKEQPWMIRLMRVHQPHADALPELQLIIVAALPVVVTLLVLGGHFFTRRWLLPLDRMAVEANRITADDLGRRLPVVNPHDELGRLANVFNVTLDRLQSSFDALDRFVADASHELRTPLTTLRSVGEVGLRRNRTVEEYREIIASMLEEAQRLQSLVERLLELASAESGGQALRRTPTRLDEIAATCVAELSVLSEQKRQQVLVDGPPCTTRTDPVLLRQALQNLIENAIKYAPEESTIRVAVRDADDHFEVSVSDTGPGIPAQDQPRLSERFFRADRARGRASGGFGLGLSITQAYLRALGGSLEYESVQPHGSSFRLRLPKE
jgi:two-component system OmpR family sensor kinase